MAILTYLASSTDISDASIQTRRILLWLCFYVYLVVTHYVALATVVVNVVVVSYPFLVAALIGAVTTVLVAYPAPVVPIAVDVGTLDRGEGCRFPSL